MTKTIDKIIQAGLFLSLTGMILVVSLQIFARFLLESAPSWTEEGARVLFLYSVAFGAGLAIRDHAYVALDSLIHSLNKRLQIVLKRSILAMVLIIMLISSYYSFIFVGIGYSETSPSLNINMSYIFSSVLILSLLVVYYTVLELKKDFTDKTSGI